MLTKADAIAVPEPVKTTGRLAIETVEAEVTRVLRWARDTAAPTFSFLIEHLGVEALWDLFGTTKTPGRVRSFSKSELAHATDGAINRFTQPAAGGLGVQGLQLLAA